MKTELRARADWARQDSDTRWTLGLKAPADSASPSWLALLGWLAGTCRISEVHSLPSGTVAFSLVASPEARAALLKLPAPRGGSRHESNLISKW